MNIITLQDSFIGVGEVSGFEFNKITETTKAYLYKVNTGESEHYEVFKKRTSSVCIDFANKIYSETDFKEIYPKSKQFGITAYCTRSMDKALDYLKHFDNERERNN